MEIYTFKLNRFILSGLFFLLVASTACNEDDEDNNLIFNDINFSNIELVGTNERPPVNTTGYGIMDVKYNDDTNTLDYTISWTLGNPNDNTTAMHFHGPADRNSTAPPVIDIPNFDTDRDGTVTGSTRELSPQEEADLRAGLWYVNIHSTTYPNGELRGNLLK